MRTTARFAQLTLLLTVLVALVASAVTSSATAGPLLLEATNTPSPTPPNPPADPLTVVAADLTPCTGCTFTNLYDGDTNTKATCRENCAAGSATYTIDLGSPQYVAYIRLFSTVESGDVLQQIKMWGSLDGLDYFQVQPQGMTPTWGEYWTHSFGATARYVRVTQGINNWSGLAEFQAYGGTAPARGGLAYTVSQYSGGLDAFQLPLLGDGTTNTHLLCGAGCHYGTSSIMLDLGALVSVTGIRLYAAVASTDPSDTLTSAVIATSVDGEDWTTLDASVSPTVNTWWEETYAPTAARYVRITQTVNKWWAIGELEVYGSAGAATPVVVNPNNYLSDPTFRLAPLSSPWSSNWWSGNVSRVSGPGTGFDGRLPGISGGPCDTYYWRLQTTSTLLGSSGRAYQKFTWPGGPAYIEATTATTDGESHGKVWVEDDFGAVFDVFGRLSFVGQWQTSQRVRQLPAGEYTFNVQAGTSGSAPGSFLIGSVSVREGDYDTVCPDWTQGNMVSGYTAPVQTLTAAARLTATALGTPQATATPAGYVTATAQATVTASATPAYGTHTNRFGNCGFESGTSGWVLEPNTRLISPGGATGPTYALIDSARHPGLVAPFTWPGGVLYVTYWVGPYSRISTAIRPVGSFGFPTTIDNNYSTAAQADWVKRFGMVTLPAGNYQFEASNTAGYQASLDGLALTDDGYSTASTACGNADSGGALATAWATQQTQQAQATATHAALLTREAATNAAATANATATFTPAPATATVLAQVTPSPTNTPVLSAARLTQDAATAQAQQTAQAATVQANATRYAATSQARATATAQAQATQTRAARNTQVALEAQSTLPATATPNVTATEASIILTAQAPYFATATMQAFLTATAEGTVVATPQPWPTATAAPGADVLPLVSWLQWQETNTQQITDVWSRLCDREPFGTICETRVAYGDLRDVWSRVDWATTGFEGEEEEQADPLVFLRAAPDILNGNWAWNTTGTQYSEACELSVTWILGAYLTIPICFLWNIMRALGVLAWMQFFWDATMIGALGYYLRWAYIHKAST